MDCAILNKTITRNRELRRRRDERRAEESVEVEEVWRGLAVLPRVGVPGLGGAAAKKGYYTDSRVAQYTQQSWNEVAQMELEKRNAIVTGGSIGIGAAIAIAMAKEGANVAINYRKHDTEANEVVRQIETLGRRGFAVKADVANFNDAQEMVKKVVNEFGRLDVLVCNAGITRDSVVWKMSEQMWDEVITTNLKGYFNYIHAAADYFKNQRYGKIVNITSINGLRGKFGQSNYSASKGGIIALTKAVARELGKFNVNVNAVAPGMTETEMAAGLPQEWLQRAIDETVLGRLARTDDIANVVIFLASDRSRHVTGEVINVSGGQYM